jgi:hypothetical protein
MPQRALMLGSCRYKSIESILKHRLDEQPLEEQQELALPDTHDNIRGPAYGGNLQRFTHKVPQQHSDTAAICSSSRLSRVCI